ncbi:MAG TPA: HNH endonuclease family protein, partial [Candidatus Hydrogenedentes bacterium]|nr:HNH endonuclease family protein [Candidatus Hydrogenedentota bacterium]
DLLKNYLFSRVNAPTEKKMLERRWQSLLETVRAEHFPEFLRYHLLCEYPKIRKQRLFKIVRDRVSTVQDVFGLMDALEARAELFSALSDPHHGYWQENPDAKLPIRELKLFKSRQLTPMLFAAWEKLSPADFSRILRLASVVIFRYTVVSTLNTNALEPVSHATAKALLTGDARTPAAVFERLKPVYVDNGRFEKAFATLSITTQGQKKTLAKYILSKLETDASGRACDYETDPATIEHIFPENAPAEWDDAVSPEEGRDAVYRLGNLVLLESAINRDIGNRPYPQKVGGYQKSQYATARVLAEMAPNEWTLPLINRRQEEMAKRAAHVWRADFS